jgi:two-component system, chemotaxis family, CheB/CheR fusion protein
MSKKKSVDNKVAKVKTAPVDEPGDEAAKVSTDERFPIVGLGASAGGLEALQSFFSEVSEDSAMAYIVLVHLPPKLPSMMPELLKRNARIPVSSARDGEAIEPNHVYVIPPDKEITIYQGGIQLMGIGPKRVPLPIDSFLSSLALDQGSNAVAIILSGTGTDGTLGVKEIKANNGLVLVQSEESAGYDGMPRSAISTGLADMVIAPEKMPKILDHYYRHPRTSFSRALTSEAAAAASDQRQWLNKILAVLRTRVGHDFSAYKISTILRRIDRRMGLNQIKSHENYVRFLRENPGEAEVLFRELLIGVTNFFRDPESFEVLKNRILPDVFKQMQKGATFRAWIPGCSTGEEVYSLAIILSECLGKIPGLINLQLFGTDIDKNAIEKAREGLFPASIAAEVSEERLKRFFIEEGDFFRIRKEVRDSVVFSVQDVLTDPPFSRLNLLCCRNLMIYLVAEVQKRLLPLFHYTLAPGGILMLGSSETIGGFTGLFETLDKKWKIFKRREVPETMRQLVDFPSGPATAEPAYRISPEVPAVPKANLALLTQKAILNQFAPPAILIDASGQILHVQGRTGKYLETPSGPPSLNILDLAREGLRIALSSALRAAKSSKKNVIRKRVAVKTNGNVQMIDLHVCPQDAPDELAGKFLVVFEDIDITSAVPGSKPSHHEESGAAASTVAELEKELRISQESHQTTVEELESSNEELKSTNEELQSSNEELQSTNEELESSREELQSLNEELQTINAELQNKLEELSAAHDDMHNLLNSTEIATIFVDNDMRVRRFTTEATAIVNLIQTDIGRPLKHVATNLSYEEMIKDLAEVLEKLTPRKVEVKTIEGKWYHMRIIPYRTTNNRIDGAILTFTNIDDQKKAQKMIEESTWQLVRAIFDMNPMPMVVLDKDAKMVIANTAFSGIMKISQADIKGKDVYNLQASITDQLKLKSKLENALMKDKDFNTERFEMETPQGKRNFSIDGRIIKSDADFPYRLLLEFIMKQ